MKKKLTATAMLLSLGASGASAQVLNLQGSDTLGDLLNDPVNGILQLCPAANAVIDYAGGGSTNGENAAINDSQEIAPMSRFLNSGACSHNASATSGCFQHSLDGLAVAAVQTGTEDCDAVRWDGNIALSSGTYTVQNWRTVLRIIYGGQSDQPAAITGHNPCLITHPSRSAIATKDCGSEVRRALVNNWGNMFVKADGTACTNGACTALKHAFRRDDVSGTTDTFLELLALPAITTNPFCNGNEAEDADPIRRACTGAGFANGEQVCGLIIPNSARDTTPGTEPNALGEGLGVVLPVLIPQNDPFGPGGAGNQLCAGLAIGGEFGDVSMPFGTTICPDGTGVRGGNCRWPKRQGSAAGTGFDCINGRNNLPLALPTGSFDGRAYNLVKRNNAGVIQQYQRRTATGVANRNMIMATYRIHQNRAITGSTLVANTGCAFANETQQIGCLVEASPCSIGFSGLTALNDQATNLPDANRKGLGLRSAVNTSNEAIFPTKADVRLVLSPSGAGCDGDAVRDGGFEDRYPFARGLWLCTVDGVPGFAGATGWVDTGTQSAAQLQAQADLVSCTTNRAIVDQAANNAGFVTLDDTGAAPVNFVTCSQMGLPQ